MSRKPVFTRKKRRVLRKDIPTVEALVSAVIVIGLGGILLWFFGQQEQYDPAERDLSYELLAQKPVEDNLYKIPLKRWVDPALAQGNVAPAINLGIFPEAILDDSWQLSSRLKTFKEDTLFEKINGEAPKFLRQGFQQLSYVSIQSPEGDEISIELFDQGGLKGSLGVFSEHRSADQPILREGKAIYFRTPAGVIGMLSQYFFRIAGNQSSETIQAKAKQLVIAFAGLPEQKEQESLEFKILTDQLNIEPALIAYQAKNVFQYDFATDFWFGQPDAKQPMRYFIHRAESPETAQETFELIVEEHGFDYEIQDEAEGRVLMWHPFLKSHFVIQQTDAYVFGLENVSDEEELESQMETLIKAIRSSQP